MFVQYPLQGGESKAVERNRPEIGMTGPNARRTTGWMTKRRMGIIGMRGIVMRSVLWVMRCVAVNEVRRGMVMGVAQWF